MSALMLLLSAIIGFLVAFLRNKGVQSKDQKTIAADQAAVDRQAQTAEEAVKAYEKALRDFDPKFHDDDGSGKPNM